MHGSTILTATDAKAFWANNAFVPLSMDKMEAMLSAHGALLGAILGANHPNLTGHFQAIADCNKVKHSLKRAVERAVGV